MKRFAVNLTPILSALDSLAAVRSKDAARVVLNIKVGALPLISIRPDVHDKLDFDPKIDRIEAFRVFPTENTAYLGGYFTLPMKSLDYLIQSILNHKLAKLDADFVEITYEFETTSSRLPSTKKAKALNHVLDDDDDDDGDDSKPLIDNDDDDDED